MTGTKHKEPRNVSLEDDPTYWQASGRFIEMFATAENILLSYLAHITPVTIPTSRAIFYGWRADSAIEAIRRIWKVQAQWKDASTQLELKEVDDVLAHFKAINTMRNSLVHHASFITSDKGRITSNVAHALTPSHIKERRASTQIVGQMTADLWKAAHHLLSFILKQNRSSRERVGAWAVLNDAWQYKPGEDQTGPAKPHKDRGKQKH